MWRPLTLIVLSALLGCVGHRALGDNQACPCAPGWSCNTSLDVCVANGGSGGGGFSGDGGGGFSSDGGGGSPGSAAGGSSGGTISVPGACSLPEGHVMPYTTVADLETLIVGDWLHCGVASYPPGLRIAPDHTWSLLLLGDAGALQPITTGFEGYGTWTAVEVYEDHVQFNLLNITGGGAGGFPIFLDTGQMRLSFGAPGDYVRMSGGGSSGRGGGGFSGSGAGGTVSIPGPGDCSAPDGHVVPHTTLAEFERLLEGDWLRCRGNAYPSAFGVGLRISPDHTWNALAVGDAGALYPITTGFDGYGPWTATELGGDRFQFNLLKLAGGGAGFVVTFTDTGQMRTDFSTSAADYVRLGAGGAS